MRKKTDPTAVAGIVTPFHLSFSCSVVCHDLFHLLGVHLMSTHRALLPWNRTRGFLALYHTLNNRLPRMFAGLWHNLVYTAERWRSGTHVPIL